MLMGILLIGVLVSVVAAQWIGSGGPGETTENITAATPGGIDLPDERPEESDLSENTALVRDSTTPVSTETDGTGGNGKTSPTPTVGDSGGQIPPATQVASTSTPLSNPTSTNSPLNTETPTLVLSSTPTGTGTPDPSATPTPTSLSPTDTPQPTSTLTQTPVPTNTAAPTPRPTIKPQTCKSDPGHDRYCTPTP